MSRLVVGCCVALAACGISPRARIPEPENLVIIALDTFRADHIGAYGNEEVLTPALDAFAAEAILFEDCASTSTWTLPSFASLFTGRLPLHHQTIGGDHAVLPEDQVTLPERFQASGFHTSGWVAVDYLGPQFGMNRGFDRWKITTGSQVTGRLRRYQPQVLGALTVPPESPALFFVHYFDAHDPYRPPGEFSRLYYSGDPTVEPADPARSIDVIYSEKNRIHLPGQNRIHMDRQRRYHWLDGVRDLEYPVSQYAGGVTYLDSELSVVLDSLRATGFLDDSVVVVLGDHGEHLTEHDIYFTHRLPYQECLHVPLMIRLPQGALGGRRVATPVSLVDVLPTLLDLFGLEPADGLDGRSLLPEILGEESPKRLLFAEYGAAGDNWAKSVWDADWRYTELDDHGVFTRELFDRRADPAETRNVAAERPDLVELYSAALDARFGAERRLLADPARETTPAEIDPGTRERLEALGYVDLGG